MVRTNETQRQHNGQVYIIPRPFVEFTTFEALLLSFFHVWNCNLRDARTKIAECSSTHWREIFVAVK